MEKDSARHYRAYEGFKPANNGNTSSLKRSTSDRSKTHPSRQVRCLCFGGVPDKASQHSFLKGCIINLGICALLVAYTLLGSFIFLAIEGGTDAGIQQRTLATTIAENQPTRRNTTAWLKQVNHEARAKTVENIWIITESLNILYRENWTRLAAQEIARFQDQLVKRITEDMMATQNAGTYVGSSTSDTVTERRIPEYEWNFAKAFLYSLTVLTTIGGCFLLYEELVMGNIFIATYSRNTTHAIFLSEKSLQKFLSSLHFLRSVVKKEAKIFSIAKLVRR